MQMAFGKNGEVIPNVQGELCSRHSQLNLGLSPLSGLAWNYGLYLIGQDVLFCGSLGWEQTRLPVKVSIVC